ncbi:hypothetical protein N7488_005129 [Penicillium malachiteum]|nr:hypothetical protein N7488_005129 [Penicillium malachiteum]
MNVAVAVCINHCKFRRKKDVWELALVTKSELLPEESSKDEPEPGKFKGTHLAFQHPAVEPFSLEHIRTQRGSFSHKNDLWQPYAALTAAAYAEELLQLVPVEPSVGSDVGYQPPSMDLKSRPLGTRTLAGGLILVLMGQTFLQTVVENEENKMGRRILTWLGTLDFAEKQNVLL